MADKRLKIIFTASILFIVAFFAIIGTSMYSDRSVEYDYEADLESVSSYDDVIRFAGGSDFSPFSYIDENGLPCGRDVELAFALGREMGCRVEVTLGDWTKMQEGILDGTYDVLITVDYSDERSSIMGYTSPVCLDSYVYFGRDSSINLSDIQSIRKLKIAALEGGGATDNYLGPMNLLENTTFYSTQVEAFESVEKGINDVAIAGYIYGSNIIAGLDMDLVQVGNPLYGAAYYFTYDIDNAVLGPKLNAGLARLESSGDLTRIEEKWTTHYQPNLTLSQYLDNNKENVTMLGMLAFVFIIIVVEIFVGTLRKRERLLLERDQLTGLYNRNTFLKKLEEIILRADGREYVLIRFDLDNFKSFNETQGRNNGDKLLKGIGNSLEKEDSLPVDIILTGYLGADHFALIAQKGISENGPGELYKYIKKVLSEVYPGYYLNIRLGLCNLESDDEPAKCCDRAQLAIKSIKNDYYRHWAWFDEEIQKRLDEENRVKEKMYPALHAGRFVPYFQPQYDYSTGKISGAEVLARWIDEDGSILPPSVFIPVFEKNGFIYEMDKNIWKQSFKCISTWTKEGILPGHLSINISRAEIYHTDLIDTILDTIYECGITIDDVHFEITESAYIDNSSLIIEAVNRLKSIGAYVEMDDFGSGYSSLSALKDMNIDLVKLDMSLLVNNTLEGKDSALLDSLINMVHNLKIDLIAEGVEDKKQADYLLSRGCFIMQGYLFSRPLCRTDFESLLRSRKDGKD